MRLLVVEDDKDLAQQLRGALADAGYAVDVAHAGREGHFLGDTEPYDAVLLDLGLPEMDGITLSLINISEPKRPERSSYVGFCLKKKKAHEPSIHPIFCVMPEKHTTTVA